MKINHTYFYYIKIDERILKMRDLTPSDKLLYGLLFSMSRNDNSITARNLFLADALGLSIDTIKKSLSTLRNKGLINIVNSNKYRVISLNHLEVIKKSAIEIDDELTDDEEKYLEKIYNGITVFTNN